MPSFPLLKNSNVKYFLQQPLHHLLSIWQAVLKLQNFNVFLVFTDYLTTFITKYYPCYAMGGGHLYTGCSSTSYVCVVGIIVSNLLEP